MGKSDEKQYFASLPEFGEEYASAVLDRFGAHCAALRNSHRHNRMYRAWCMYFSRSRDGDWDDTELAPGGRIGELTIIRPNEYRNLLQTQLGLVTQSPPGYECVAVSTDSEALAQAILGNGILDYYLRVNHLDDLRVRRAEIALMFGESFLLSYWDPAAGKEYGVQPDGQSLNYEGDLAFRVYTPYDVAYDPLSPDLQRPRWSVVKEPVNRWDLAEKFGHDKTLRGAILDAESYSGGLKEWGLATEYDHDDYISVYRVGVEKSASCPGGRESLVLDPEHVLFDAPLSEDRVGLFRLPASDVIFQSGGYTNNFDVLPVAEAYQAQASTILSNHTAFAGQVIAAPKGSGVKPHQLGRGLSLLEYVPYDDASGKPMPAPGPIQFLATPEEVFTFLDWLQAAGERYSGIHAVMRGQTNASDSGSKTALLHATSQQFANQFHRNLSRSDEDIGSFVIASLRSHATVERVATIAGKWNSFASRKFKGDDLSKISRVTVRAASPMRDSYMGRLEFSDRYFALPEEDREKFVQVTSTGRVETVTDGPQAQMLLIRRENEQLRDPTKEEPFVADTDDHYKHIDEHRSEYDDPAVREAPDQQVRERVKSHIRMHVWKLTPGRPEFIGMQLCEALNMKPLSPVQDPAAAAATAANMPAGDGQQAQPEQQGAPAGATPRDPDGDGDKGLPGKPALPRMPRPPKNALTGQAAQIQPPEGAAAG